MPICENFPIDLGGGGGGGEGRRELHGYYNLSLLMKWKAFDPSKIVSVEPVLMNVVEWNDALLFTLHIYIYIYSGCYFKALELNELSFFPADVMC